MIRRAGTGQGSPDGTLRGGCLPPGGRQNLARSIDVPQRTVRDGV